MSRTVHRGATRDLLAKTIASLLVVLSCAVVTIAVWAPAAVSVVERIYFAIVGLAVIVARSYFPAR